MDLKIPFIQSFVKKLEEKEYLIDENFLVELENNIKKIIVNQIENNDNNNLQNKSDLQLSYFIIEFSKIKFKENFEDKYDFYDKKFLSSIKLINEIILKDENLLKTKLIWDNLIDIFKFDKNNFLNFYYKFQNELKNNENSYENFEIHKNIIIYLIKIKDFKFLTEYLKIFNLNNLSEYIGNGVPFDDNEDNYKDLLLDFMINIKKYGNYNWIKWIIDNQKIEIENDDLINWTKTLFRNNFNEIKNKIFNNNEMNFIDNLYYKLNTYFNKTVIYNYIIIRKNNKNLVENYLEDFKIAEYFNNLNIKDIFKKLFNDYDENFNLLDILIELKENYQNINYFESKFFSLFKIVDQTDKYFFFDFFLNLLNNNYNFDSIKIFLDSLIKDNLDSLLIVKVMNGFSNELDIKYQLSVIDNLIDSKHIEKETINEYINNYYKNDNFKEIYFNNNKNSINLGSQKSQRKSVVVFNEDKLIKELENCNYNQFYKDFQVYKRSINLKKEDNLIKELIKIYEIFDFLSENNLFSLFLNLEKKDSIDKLLFLNLIDIILDKPIFNNIENLQLNIFTKLNLNLQLNYFILSILDTFEGEIENKILLKIFKYNKFYNDTYLKYPDYLKNDSKVINQNNYLIIVINKLI